MAGSGNTQGGDDGQQKSHIGFGDSAILKGIEGERTHPDHFDNVADSGTRRHRVSEALSSAATNAMTESPEHGRL